MSIPDEIGGAAEVTSRRPDPTAHVQIYFQGFLDTGCFLYAQANAYKALTGKRITRDHWNRAIALLPTPTLFLGGPGATEFTYEEAVDLIGRTLEAFSDPGETFIIDKLSSSAGVAELCGELSPTSVVVFAYRGPTEFQNPATHVVCGVAATDQPEQTLHLACSAAFSARYLSSGDYFERHHPNVGRWSNDSISVVDKVVIAPDFRWRITLRPDGQ